MSYGLKWHPQAYKSLERLPKQLIQRVLRKFDAVIEDPFRYLEHFEGEGVYKLRIGEYRALIAVNEENKLLLVQAFDHRSRIYKR